MDAERDEMRDLAERLAELDDEQWNSPSLCAQWRIRDVLAHLTAGAEGAFGFGWILRSTLRHGFSYNRWVAADRATTRSTGSSGHVESPSECRGQPKCSARSSAGPSLMHVLIHGQDICRPLGITRDLPEAHLVPVANMVKNDVHLFGAKTRIAGLKLTATDMDWSHGSGPEVTGPAEALVMMMAGRLVALDDLSGEGTSVLVGGR